MSNSTFWKVAAALHILALLYVGHGLHGAPTLATGGFTKAANAAAVQTIATTDDRHLVCTSSENGKTLYLWDVTRFLTTYYREDVQPIRGFAFAP